MLGSKAAHFAYVGPFWLQVPPKKVFLVQNISWTKVFPFKSGRIRKNLVIWEYFWWKAFRKETFRLGNKNLKPMDYEKIQISLYNGSDLLGNWESSNLSELNKRLEAFSSNLKDGAYFLKLTKGNQTQVIKLVKQ